MISSGQLRMEQGCRDNDTHTTLLHAASSNTFPPRMRLNLSASKGPHGESIIIIKTCH